jgi:hypothetical protein
VKLYELADISVMEYAMRDGFTAPFYQRVDSRWDTQQAKRFNLAVSMCIGLPPGMITTKTLPKGGKAEHHIIDGRQRKAAIKAIMNPYEFASEIQTSFPYNKKKHGASGFGTWKDKIEDHVKAWFSSYSFEECKNAAESLWVQITDEKKKAGMTGVKLSREVKDSFKDDYLSRGITIKEKAKAKVIEEAARGESQSSALLSTHTLAITPLWKFADSACPPGTGGHSPRSAIDKILKDIGYKNWNSLATRTVNLPFFWVGTPGTGTPKCEPKKLFEEFTEWIYDLHKSKTKIPSFFDFIDHIDGKGNIVAVDIKSSISGSDSAYFNNLIEKTWAILDELDDSLLSWCKLEKKTTVAESMKVFQLINATGAEMKTFELMASWPTWIEEVVPVMDPASKTDNKKSKKWKAVWERIDRYYEGKGTEPRPDHLGLTKWDLAAILADEIDHSMVWGV